MFETERHMTYLPWRDAHRWIDLHGEESWEILCAVTPVEGWFKISDVVESYTEYSSTSVRELGARQIRYLLTLASKQKEPSVERKGHFWRWLEMS